MVVQANFDSQDQLAVDEQTQWPLAHKYYLKLIDAIFTGDSACKVRGTEQFYIITLQSSLSLALKFQTCSAPRSALMYISSVGGSCSIIALYPLPLKLHVLI